MCVISLSPDNTRQIGDSDHSGNFQFSIYAIFTASLLPIYA